VHCASFSNPQTLYLDTNTKLGGRIPRELSSLVKATEIHLYQNSLTGPLPSELGMLDGLLYLYIGECLSSIVARILRKVFIFQYMRFYLWLEDSNELTGPIPEEWGGMKDLEQLFVNGNQLSGEIPITIRGMESLHYLRANDNQLSGELPSDIGKMLKMEYIYLEDNDIQCSVPSQLGELSKLKVSTTGLRL
jgi:Leucine-rich repeat (LRR) protein